MLKKTKKVTFRLTKEMKNFTSRYYQICFAYKNRNWTGFEVREQYKIGKSTFIPRGEILKKNSRQITYQYHENIDKFNNG